MTCTACGQALPEGVAACPSCGELTGAPIAAPATAARVRASAPRPGPELLGGRYQLVEKVGEGGMGTVYVAHDQELDRQVAVKLLAPALVNDAEVVERFEREARLTARLDHPNIVPIYDVGRHGDRPFIVMKLLSGDSLAGVLRKKGGLTTDETQRLARQLAAGLDYIHGQGFIHRDIKSGNIFVAPDGHATILDFGILRPKDATAGLTRTGMVMGTPHYMAPEQALGLTDVDHRVDLYALAVVLFECLTGTLPFEADSELKLVQLQAHAPPPDLIDRAPWISRPVADVVRRALAKDPAERFNTGAELVAALDAAWRAGQGSTPAPATPAAPATVPSLRKLASADVPAAPDPSTTGALAAAAGGGRSRAVVAALVLLGLAAAGVAAWRLGAADPPPNEGADPTLVAAPGPGPTAPSPGAVAGLVDELLDAGPEGAPDAAVAADGGAEEDPEEETDAGAAPRPAAAPRLVRTGRVNIISVHRGEAWWAQVSVDGVSRGRTPLLLDLPLGAHQVRVERPGFRTQAREIKVAPGRVVVRFDLSP